MNFETKEVGNKKEIFLIDTENPGSSLAFCLMDERKKNREFHYFYTNQSLRLSFPHIERMMQLREQVHMQECYNGYRNALDFQISSALGYLIANEEKETVKFVIVSNDHGYEPLIRFWNQKGYEVERLGEDLPGMIHSYTNVDCDKSTYGPEREEHNNEEMQNLKSDEAAETEPTLEEETYRHEQKEADSEHCDIPKLFTDPGPRIGPKAAKMDPKRYDKACQVMASQLGTLFKKKKIKCREILKVSELMICNVNYTLDDLEQITDPETAKKIFKEISRNVVAGYAIVARKRSW